MFLFLEMIQRTSVKKYNPFADISNCEIIQKLSLSFRHYLILLGRITKLMYDYFLLLSIDIYIYVQYISVKYNFFVILIESTFLKGSF